MSEVAHERRERVARAGGETFLTAPARQELADWSRGEKASGRGAGRERWVLKYVVGPLLTGVVLLPALLAFWYVARLFSL